MEGWLKLHRALIESAVFSDPEVLKVWIWLLCSVAYENHDVLFMGKVIQLQAGQIATGRKKMAQATDLSESKVYRALNILKNIGNISIKANNKYSVITVLNWEKFQSGSVVLNNKATAKQQRNNNKATTKQQQDNTTKEYKESKESKEIKKGGFLPSGVAPNGVPYVLIDGKMYDEDGFEINAAGFKVIEFGLSKKSVDF